MNGMTCLPPPPRNTHTLQPSNPYHPNTQNVQVPKARPLLLFRLGLSLGKLLLLFDGPNNTATAATTELPPPSLGETAAFVRALAQLFEVRGVACVQQAVARKARGPPVQRDD